MATITYKCSICDRNIDLLENPIGLTTFSKCVITYGCKGKLLSVKRNQDNIRETFPAEVPGLIDYSPRNVLSNYNQTVPSATWIINHNLNTTPAVTVYVDNVAGTKSLLDINSYKIVTVNSNQIKLVMNGAYSGSAQLISRNSIKADPTIIATPDSLTQVTANGTFVFAVPKYLTKFLYPPTNLPPPELPYDLSSIRLRIEVSIQKPNEEATVCTEYVDANLSNTPWNSWGSILVRKRKNYYLFSINILNFRTFGGETTKYKDIPNGTQLKITRIDYGTGVLQPIDTEGLFIMLSNAPYTINDKIKNMIVDVGDMVNNDINYFIYTGSDFFVDTKNVDKTYPDISKTNPVVAVIAPTPSVTPTITPTMSPPPSATPMVTPTPTPAANSLLINQGDPYIVYPFSSITKMDYDQTLEAAPLLDVSNVQTGIKSNVDGKLYIGGQFSSVNGQDIENFARLNADGSLDDSYNLQFSNTVNYIYQTNDNKIYVGGYFDSIGGITYDRLGRLNSNNLIDTDFVNIVFDDGVSCIAQTNDNKIYIAGDFSTVNGANTPYFIRLNSDGTVDDTFTDLGLTSYPTINSIIQTIDDKIYMTGYFTNQTSIPDHLARLNSDGTVDATFADIEVDDALSAILQSSDGKIYIGGYFNTVGGNSYTNFARLNSDGTVDATFADIGFTQQVNHILQTGDGKIYVTTSDSSYAHHIVRLNSDGTLDNTFVQTFDNTQITYPLDIGTALMLFASPEGALPYEIANTSGLLNLNAQYDPSVLSAISNMAQLGSYVYFSNNSTQTIQRLFSSDYSFDSSYQQLSYSGGTLTDSIQTNDGKIYLCNGNNSMTVDGSSYSGIARLNIDGSLDTDFIDLETTASWQTMMQSADGKIYIFGFDYSLNTFAINRLTIGGEIDTEYTPPVLTSGGNIYDSYQTLDGKIYVVGSFNGFLSEYTYGNIARFNSDGTLDSTFVDLAVDDVINGISQAADGKIYIVGRFSNIGETPYSNVARLNSDGTLDTTFEQISVLANYSPVNFAYISPSDGSIYLGTRSGQYPVVKLSASGVYDETFTASLQLNLGGHSGYTNILNIFENT